MPPIVDLQKRRVTQDRAVLTASLAATRAALPFLGQRRPPQTAFLPRKAPAPIPRSLTLALLSGLAAALLLPLSRAERQAGHAALAPAGRVLWRGTVDAGAMLITERALAAVARVLRGGA